MPKDCAGSNDGRLGTRTRQKGNCHEFAGLLHKPSKLPWLSRRGFSSEGNSDCREKEEAEKTKAHHVNDCPMGMNCYGIIFSCLLSPVCGRDSVT